MALHTDIPSEDEVRALAEERSAACVSIYMPTHRVSQDAQRDRILLKDLTRRATDQLHEAGTDGDAVADLDAGLMDIVEDHDFWATQADSLAVFATPQHVRTFRLPNELTQAVEVSDRFHLKPLMRTLTFPHEAWILAVSRQSVRLLELGPSGAPEAIEVPGLPEPILMEPNSDQLRTTETSRYVQRIDRALRKVLGSSKRPLVLAAAEPLVGNYRTANTYPHLAPGHLAGTPDDTPDADLAAAARGVLDEVYREDVARLHELFDRRRGEGRAATDLSDIARAATLGAVDTVLVDIDAAVPGAIDEETGAVEFHEGADAGGYGVVDEIVRRVLLNGGRVMALRADEVPDGGAAAAILRYIP